MNIKSGIGFDAHRFCDDRKLILGGIEIPYHKGLAGHSDADVLIHAIIDSLVGPALCKDIGVLFPDTDQSLKNIDSKELLKQTIKLIKAEGWSISHIDSEIIAQVPKISPYIDKMRKVLSDIIGIDITSLSIKATTTEKMGFTGREEGIAVIASSIIIKGV